MKKKVKKVLFVALLIPMFSLMVACSGGVSQEDYDALKNELDTLKQQYAELNQQNSPPATTSDESDEVQNDEQSKGKENKQEYQESDIGTRKVPAGIDDEVTFSIASKRGTGTVNAVLTQVIRGNEANTMIAEANQFNDYPGENQEYILANFTITFVEDKSGTDTALEISKRDFDYSTTDYSIQKIPSLVLPEPSLDLVLYEGATGSGWVAFLAEKGEETPRAVLNDTIWFNLQ